MRTRSAEFGNYTPTNPAFTLPPARDGFTFSKSRLQTPGSSQKKNSKCITASPSYKRVPQGRSSVASLCFSCILSGKRSTNRSHGAFGAESPRCKKNKSRKSDFTKRLVRFYSNEVTCHILSPGVACTISTLRCTKTRDLLIYLLIHDNDSRRQVSHSTLNSFVYTVSSAAQRQGI